MMVTVQSQIQDKDVLEGFLTISQVAEVLPKMTGDTGVTPQRAYQVVEQYNLQVKEIGSQMYIARADLDRFLETYNPNASREKPDDNTLIDACVKILTGESTRTKEAKRLSISVSLMSKVMSGTRRKGIIDQARDIVSAREALQAHQEGDTIPWDEVKAELLSNEAD